MKTVFGFMAALIFTTSAFALTDKEIIEGRDTTPLKLLCQFNGGTENQRLLIQFVKDRQADPGVYSVVSGRFYLGNKIVKTTYEMYGESYAKVGYLDNGKKVRVYLTVDGLDLIGYVDKTKALFDDGASLYNCVELKLK